MPSLVPSPSLDMIGEGGFHVSYDYGSGGSATGGACNQTLSTRIIFDCNSKSSWTERDQTDNMRVAYDEKEDPCSVSTISIYTYILTLHNHDD